MNQTRSLAAVALLAFTTLTPPAFAQSTPAAQAARQQKLQAAQAAARARAAAAAATATTAPTVAPTAAPTTAPTPAATVAPPRATATATAAPSAAATVAPPKATASASASAAPATSGSAAPAPARPDAAALALDIEALRKSRPDRRHAEFAGLQSRWGNLLTDPRSADELKLHAQRLAYLQRIRALGAKDPAFVKSVDALITKEETRNSDALNALRSGALPVAAPAAGATK